MVLIQNTDGSVGETLKPAHKPTEEQEAIVAAFVGGQNLVVEAGAGCGKTSTLRLATIARQGRGTYVAYNKPLAEDARRSFPGHCDCRTAHSLAYRDIGYQFKDRLNGPRQPMREVARKLGIKGPLEVSKLRVILPHHQARAVMETIGHFCNSNMPEIQRIHVSQPEGLTGAEYVPYVERILELSVQAWDDLKRMSGVLPFSHDVYLKLWQLGSPYIETDYILLDEAQDASPVMADVFERQNHAQRIMVGDQAQAIYGWRGAIDAMHNFEADARLQLSQSFRFGPAIAEEAAKWLVWAESTLKLRGFEPLQSRLVELSQPLAILCRTNAEVVGQAIKQLEVGRKVAVVGGGTQLRSLADAALSLKAGRGTEHPELYLFKSWDELTEYAQDAGGELRVLVKLIDQHGAEGILKVTDALVEEDRAQVIISTAHKAKGREWRSVAIANDFMPPKANEDGTRGRISRAEAMLAYVSVTRAKEELDRGGLAWIDKYTQKEWSREERA